MIDYNKQIEPPQLEPEAVEQQQFKEQTESFFDMSAFEDEYTTEKEQTETGPIDAIEEEEEVFLRESDRDTFILLWKQLDKWRATAASVWSGQPVKKYLVDQDIAEDEEVCNAGARVVAKYRLLRNSPELILAAAIIASSIGVIAQAKGDVQKKKRKEKREEKTKQDEGI